MSESEQRHVWHLVIEKSGSNDRLLHTSHHETPLSTCLKAKRVLNYDVPDFSEWYKKPRPDDAETTLVGYVLDRDEIDVWPIRIEATKEEVKSLTDTNTEC